MWIYTHIIITVLTVLDKPLKRFTDPFLQTFYHRLKPMENGMIIFFLHQKMMENETIISYLQLKPMENG
jgi:hypothetical protein